VPQRTNCTPIPRSRALEVGSEGASKRIQTKGPGNAWQRLHCESERVRNISFLVLTGDRSPSSLRLRGASCRSGATDVLVSCQCPWYHNNIDPRPSRINKNVFDTLDSEVLQSCTVLWPVSARFLLCRRFFQRLLALPDNWLCCSSRGVSHSRRGCETKSQFTNKLSAHI
jgi:hypothetical protein